MARLAWIASEVGSATGFPNGNIIAQKSRHDEGRESWLDAAYSIRYTPRRLSCLTAKYLPNWWNSRIVAAPEITQEETLETETAALFQDRYRKRRFRQQPVEKHDRPCQEYS
jgi:hypothetical protein